MSCILRACGRNLDVDALLETLSMQVQRSWRAGEKRSPGSAVDEHVLESSGVQFVASETEFSEFPKQIEDAILFLRNNQDDIRKLVSFSGVEGAVLDFGAEIHPPGWSSFSIPPELLSLAGTMGVALCISVYPTDDEVETDN